MPTDLSRDDAVALVPIGWVVLVHRLYDVLEAEQGQGGAQGPVPVVVTVLPDRGCLKIICTPWTPMLERVRSETMRASMRTCEFCTRSGRIRYHEWQPQAERLFGYSCLCDDCWEIVEWDEAHETD